MKNVPASKKVLDIRGKHDQDGAIASSLTALLCGKFLASGSADYIVKMWNLETGKAALNIQCDARVHQLAFHPTGKWLAVSTASGEKRISIRAIATGKELLSLKCDGGWRGMGFNAAGTQLTAITSDCIQAWELVFPK